VTNNDDQYKPIWRIGPEAADAVSKKPTDPNVKLPDAVKDSIARGEAAFKKYRATSRRMRKPKTVIDRKAAGGRGTPRFITSIADRDDQDWRQATLDGMARNARGAVGQPPMLDRLQAVRIAVDRLVAEGVPFDISPDSEMTQRVREWLNENAAASPDRRKSRRKQLSPDAVQDILRQVKDLG
jgi:hypothetical protein